MDNYRPLWMILFVPVPYAYELRRGEYTLATGRLTAEQELAAGDELTVAGVVARVKQVGWANGEQRLTLEEAFGRTTATAFKWPRGTSAEGRP